MVSNFDKRLTILEKRVDVEAHARAGLDADLSRLEVRTRATHQIVQALAETQSEHTRKLDQMEGRLGQVEGRLGQVESGLTLVQGGVTQIVGMLTQLIERDGAAPPSRDER